MFLHLILFILVKRIHILGIPVDVVDDEALPGAIEDLYLLKDHRQIVFLDFHELMRARHNSERRLAITQAALVIPVSSLIVRASRFLHREIPPLRQTSNNVLLFNCNWPFLPTPRP